MSGMKNLRLNHHYSQQLDSFKFSKVCFNACQNEVYAVSSSGIHLLKQNEHHIFCQELWETYTSKLSQVISADYVTSINCLCFIYIEGDIITANLEDQLVDVVGSVSDGIQAACWSPDHELLAIATATSVILMTADFEPIGEISLEQEDFGEHKFINVGWGKKETQFHGSEGKQAAKDCQTKTCLVSDFDDRKQRISWRGDGQLFGISYASHSSNQRKFRIINREGIIQFTSEIVEGLEQAFSWRPSGNLIACSQSLSNKHNIIFFEKNGLKKSQFTLPSDTKDKVVKEVSWNSDSSILLVFLESVSKPQSTLQFWKVSNYHWYLKEEINFDENIIDLCWNIDNSYILFVLTSLSFHEFTFVNTTDISNGLTEKDMALVAMVDGNKLLLTPFRQAVVPPPMSAYEISFPNQVHAIMFAPSGPAVSHNQLDSIAPVVDSFSSNNICIFHGQDTLTFLEHCNSDAVLSEGSGTVKITGAGGNGFMVKTKLHRNMAQCQIELKNNSNLLSSLLFNWTWVSPVSIISMYIGESTNQLIIFNIIGLGTETMRVIPETPITIEEEVLTITAYDYSTVCIQLKNGQLFKLNLSSKTLVPWIENGIHVKFPSPCEKVIFGSFDCGKKLIGLSSRNRLYLENTQILSDCTSIHLHSDHLLLTTTSHNLVVVPLLLHSLKSLSNVIKEEWKEIGTRNLERGARLVTAVPCDTKVLLQMPRGNLEMINPRSLVVHKLKKLLDIKEYYYVMDIMRRHRIDMNLIYDHDPELFTTSIEQYVFSVNNPQWIDLFIANLNNQDVTLTTYSSNYSKNINYNNKFNEGKSEENSNKIHIVSEILRKAMISVDEQKYLLPILTTYVRSSKEGMHMALMKLKSMKESGKHFTVGFEDGLKHLMYIADANELCDVALGTYDFDLVMLVFEKSQKDPKEYLPFLNNLKNLEPDYQKFKINVHLKLYRKALESLTNFEAHGKECLELIRKESLYAEALEVFSENTNFYKSVCLTYGDYLTKKGYNNEASAMYSRAGDFHLAFNSYERADNWRKLLVTAFQLNYSKKQISDLCYSIVEKLKAKNQFEDAAIVYEKYLQNEEDAIECLTNSHKWDDAFLLAAKISRNDLIETNIKPSIYECNKTLLSELEQKEATFSQYCDRLRQVRDNKQKEYFDHLEKNDYHEMDSELCNDSSTVTGFSYQKSTMSTARSNLSSVSGKSYRSSKNKRKLDRKKYSTKEGSNFEDVGLIAVLHELMVSLDCITKTASNLNHALLYIGDDSKAKILQRTLDKILHDMQKKKYEIWINCKLPDEDSVEFGPDMTTEKALSHLGNEAHSNSYNFLIQRINKLEPHLRFPPLMENSTNWKLFSLK